MQQRNSGGFFNPQRLRDERKDQVEYRKNVICVTRVYNALTATHVVWVECVCVCGWCHHPVQQEQENKTGCQMNDGGNKKSQTQTKQSSTYI